MNKPLYLLFDRYDYDFLLNLSQSFVDTIRHSEGYNIKRLLIICGMNADITLTVSKYYKMPIDPVNKLAISIHYYIPSQFTSVNSINLVNNEKWGNENEYKDLIQNFENLKVFLLIKEFL